MTTPEFAGMTLLDADAVASALTVDGAVDGLEAALSGGTDPETDGERTRLTTATGELLLMPSSAGRYAGIKVLSSTPENATRDAPQIQGAYLLFEGAAQRPAAVIDGIALTSLRTPAVTLLALRRLMAPGERRSVVVIGGGAQARAHALGLAASADVDAASLTLIGREVEALVETAALISSTAAARSEGSAPQVTVLGGGADPQAEADAIASADVVVTCTSAPTPLFDGSLVKDDAVVVAMGSHFPDTRETDDALVTRAHVVVESRSATLREAGDVMIPIGSGILDPERITTLRDAVVGTPPPADRPRFFKFTGMPWEDLAVAVALYEAVRR